MEETLFEKKNGTALRELLQEIHKNPCKPFSWYCNRLVITQASFFRYIKLLRREDLIEQRSYKVTKRYTPSLNPKNSLSGSGFTGVYHILPTTNKWQRLAMLLSHLEDNDIVPGFNMSKSKVLEMVCSQINQLELVLMGTEYYAKCSLLQNKLEPYKTPEEPLPQIPSDSTPVTIHDFT